MSYESETWKSVQRYPTKFRNGLVICTIPRHEWKRTPAYTDAQTNRMTHRHVKPSGKMLRRELSWWMRMRLRLLRMMMKNELVYYFDCGLLDLLLLSTLKGTECTWRHWIEAGKIHISHLNIWISLMFVWMHSHCCRGIHDYFTLGWISPVSNEHNANVTMLHFINKHIAQCRTTKDCKRMKKGKIILFRMNHYARGFGGRREGWMPYQTPYHTWPNAPLQSGQCLIGNAIIWIRFSHSVTHSWAAATSIGLTKHLNWEFVLEFQPSVIQLICTFFWIATTIKAFHLICILRAVNRFAAHTYDLTHTCEGVC